jgi:hypothetical protein
MKTKQNVAAGLCAALMLFMNGMNAKAQDSEKKSAGIWDENTAKAAYADLKAKNDQAEEEAIKLLADNALNHQRLWGTYYAIKYLESIRSVKGVPALCERLLYEQYFNEIVEDKLKHPAVAALVAIGAPGAKGLLTKIAIGETDQAYRLVALGVVEEITGPDKVVATIREFRQQLQKEEEIKRLDVLMHDYEKKSGKLGENRDK